ncbi:hypothetical protein [Pseudanabaena sp. ABRG5-3]|uniref:hypothetical protein n=1 Tax=Pseudanabaena sp. ABRG5-3 TaxID=685565 RepID=UPI000F82D913|nr:hypothetical protein [Pseudanabaena sp. ABRG5-3]
MLQYLTTQGQAIGEGEEGSAFANGGLCGVLGNGGANAKNLQIFPFYLFTFALERCHKPVCPHHWRSRY